MASAYVGIDLHRRRSVIVRQNADGEVLEQLRMDNDPVALACAIEQAGPDPEVGTGRPMCCRPRAQGCTWLTRWGSKAGTIGG